MGYQSEEELAKAYALLENGKPAQARQVLADLIQYDLDNKEASFAVWCCSFWVDFISSLSSLDTFECGEGLISHWKSFHADLERRNDVVEKALYATEKGIFSLALKSYTAIRDEGDPLQQAESYRKIGLCCKKLGNYADAFNYLAQANRLAPASAPILAEMADCYALCGEEKNAKLLFREAFFINAQEIELAFLDSELICYLIRKVQEKGYTGAVLQEWIPVYGVLYGVFNTKRKLKSQEVGRLKQDIYAKENERRNPSSNLDLLTPKLIQMYFRLIDHYVQTENGREKINEILLNVKMLDRNIYSLYNAK